MSSLLNRLAFVTGAGSGIGRATCELLAKEGANVVAVDRNLASAKATLENLKSNASLHHLSLEVDVASKANIKNALEEVLKVFKQPPSVVVNSAGITRDNFLLKLSEEDFDEVINVNLKGTFLVTQIFVNAMVENNITNGSVVNIASIVGKYGNIGQANYTASKAGVEALSKTAAKEFGKFGIRCNAVLPGMIKSPMTDAVPDKVKAKFSDLIALRRFGDPKEVAEVIAFLASDKSSYVNGACIEVTGCF